MRIVTLNVKRDTKLNFDTKKRQLERWLGKSLSDDDFMKLVLFPTMKFEIRKSKRKAELVAASVLV